jgi:hypothetical protein
MGGRGTICRLAHKSPTMSLTRFSPSALHSLAWCRRAHNLGRGVKGGRREVKAFRCGCPCSALRLLSAATPMPAHATLPSFSPPKVSQAAAMHRVHRGHQTLLGGSCDTSPIGARSSVLAETPFHASQQSLSIKAILTGYCLGLHHDIQCTPIAQTPISSYLPCSAASTPSTGIVRPSSRLQHVRWLSIPRR